MTKTPLTLISFDLDNTLWSTRRVLGHAERRLQLWLKREHPKAAETSLSLTHLRALRAQVVKQNPELTNRPTPLRTTVLCAGFIEAGYSQSAAEQAAKAGFEAFIHARNQVSFFPQAIEVLSALSQQFRLVAITNGNANLQRIGIGHLFAAQYTAETVGYAKPAPEIYQHMLSEQKLPPELCLHIGDHPEEDIAAAQDCGLHAVWSNLVDIEWPSTRAKPRLYVEQLAQLPPLIAQHFKPV